jgi:hypothetical protein
MYVRNEHENIERKMLTSMEKMTPKQLHTLAWSESLTSLHETTLTVTAVRTRMKSRQFSG